MHLLSCIVPLAELLVQYFKLFNLSTSLLFIYLFISFCCLSLPYHYIYLFTLNLFCILIIYLLFAIGCIIFCFLMLCVLHVYYVKSILIVLCTPDVGQQIYGS